MWCKKVIRCLRGIHYVTIGINANNLPYVFVLSTGILASCQPFKVINRRGAGSVKKTIILMLLVIAGVIGPASVAQAKTTVGSSGIDGRIIKTAERFLGVPYVWGGTTPAGFDCSGFTRYVFSRAGIHLPRVSVSQSRVGIPVAFHNLIPGDLVFFNLESGKRVSHVGIYMGKGKFISATCHKGIAIYKFTPYWAKGYLGARRVAG